MESQTKAWNSILHFSLGEIGIIGIVVLYDDYFDCFTDTEFKFDMDINYNLDILNGLKFCKSNNPYSNYRESYNNNEFIKSVIEEFVRPIWGNYLKSAKIKYQEEKLLCPILPQLIGICNLDYLTEDLLTGYYTV